MFMMPMRQHDALGASDSQVVGHMASALAQGDTPAFGRSLLFRMIRIHQCAGIAAEVKLGGPHLRQVAEILGRLLLHEGIVDVPQGDRVIVFVGEDVGAFHHGRKVFFPCIEPRRPAKRLRKEIEVHEELVRRICDMRTASPFRAWFEIPD